MGRRPPVSGRTALLLPIVELNFAGSAPTQFFRRWDHFSESLVLAKIESNTRHAARPVIPAGLPNVDEVGLVFGNPNPTSPYQTFNSLRRGRGIR